MLNHRGKDQRSTCRSRLPWHLFGFYVLSSKPYWWFDQYEPLWAVDCFDPFSLVEGEAPKEVPGRYYITQAPFGSTLSPWRRTNTRWAFFVMGQNIWLYQYLRPAHLYRGWKYRYAKSASNRYKALYAMPTSMSVRSNWEYRNEWFSGEVLNVTKIRGGYVSANGMPMLDRYCKGRRGDQTAGDDDWRRRSG